MIDKKLTKVLERNKRIRHSNLEKRIDVVRNIHAQEGFSSNHKSALTIAEDERAYNFAYLRNSRLRDHPKSPADSGYWIDTPHHERDLSASSIIEALDGVTEDKLKQIIADLIIFNRGIIDSATDLIEAHQKDKGTIFIHSIGEYRKVAEFQDFLRYCPDKNREYRPESERRSLSHALNQLFIFYESQQAGAMSESQSSGGSHPPSAATLKERLRKWVMAQWNSQSWASQDAFIKRIREIAPPEKAETLEGTTHEEIKAWLPAKKKNSRKIT
ncbi:hypothetical protein [Citrobacter sp. RHBSTW-00671]|uniref:hypothetical protein n=1 Tax=Citrobacter sp. RHBSTW-00671 TaxID=2742660 RepID=UPI001832B6A7|nr:hypothetical protein [Citrobacter sp. RHBSTW-00671]MBA7966603.1 hypothetical protein [Citrobacter sp. RHBSTW-00671]HCJ6373365.1 hypothetical protein [Citrobacter freundii]